MYKHLTYRIGNQQDIETMFAKQDKESFPFCMTKNLFVVDCINAKSYDWSEINKRNNFWLQNNKYYIGLMNVHSRVLRVLLQGIVNKTLLCGHRNISFRSCLKYWLIYIDKYPLIAFTRNQITFKSRKSPREVWLQVASKLETNLCVYFKCLSGMVLIVICKREESVSHFANEHGVDSLLNGRALDQKSLIIPTLGPVTIGKQKGCFSLHCLRHWQGQQLTLKFVGLAFCLRVRGE